MKHNLFHLFQASREAHGSRPSLVVDQVPYSYDALHAVVSQLAAALLRHPSERVGIFASRSLPAYAGILATLASGKTYVPINPKAPIRRNLTIMELAALDLLVVDAAGLAGLAEVAESLHPGTLLLAPTVEASDVPAELRAHCHILSQEDLRDRTENFVEVEPGQAAYIMFTSGSTGVPKGVPVSHFNVWTYVHYLRERYELGPTDRFSQTFDLTFDLSVHDLFLCWSVGAALYVVPEKVLMAPAKFVKENQLTVWFSVPSMAQFMKRFRMLKENSFPDLRYSLFCGEALPLSVIATWAQAAPNSILENIYGPTEATIGITHYRVPRLPEDIQELNGVVSIGEVFDNHAFCLINEAGEKVDDTGELCLSGPQVTAGYLNNPEKTAASFVHLAGDDRRWYKTGDIVKFEAPNLFYLSRKDFQVKIRGFRIELDEINHAIRNYTHCDLVYTIPHPVQEGVAENLFSFIDVQCKADKVDILQHLKTELPEYMVPKDIFFIREFPLNPNGKIDFKQLATKIGSNDR